jgi:hypothetical protein
MTLTSGLISPRVCIHPGWIVFTCTRHHVRTLNPRSGHQSGVCHHPITPEAWFVESSIHVQQGMQARAANRTWDPDSRMAGARRFTVTPAGPSSFAITLPICWIAALGEKGVRLSLAHPLFHTKLG